MKIRWRFKDPERVDVLIEETERGDGDPVPEVIDVKFEADGEDAAMHSINSEQLDRIE